MDLAALDFPVAYRGVHALRFTAPAAIGPAGMVVWDPSAVVRAFAGAVEAMDGSRPVLGAAASQDLLAHARHWRAELRAATRAGAAVVVFLPGAPGFGVHTLQEVVDFDLLEALPAGAPARTQEHPAPVRCITGEPFRAFFHAAGEVLACAASLPDPPGRAICISNASGAVAGAYAYSHPGHLLLLPAPRPDLDDDARTRLFVALVDLVRRLRHSGRLGPLQSWAQAYSLPGEVALRASVAALHARQRDTAHALERDRASLETIDLLKQLVAGDAAGAARAAAHVLHGLGAYSQPGMDEGNAVAFEHRGVFGVATLVLDPADADAVRRAVERAAAFAPGTGADVRPVLLYCAENDRPPVARQRPPETLREGALRAGVALVTADELLRAGLERDTGLLDHLIAPAARRR